MFLLNYYYIKKEYIMKKIINTEKAPKAIGPYSQAVKIGDLLFISGQVPLNPETMKIESQNIEEQTIQVFKNIEAILKSENLEFENIVKMTVLLKDINDFSKVNTIYAKYFEKDYPARAAYEVANLPLNAKIEIESIAYYK